MKHKFQASRMLAGRARKPGCAVAGMSLALAMAQAGPVLAAESTDALIDRVLNTSPAAAEDAESLLNQAREDLQAGRAAAVYRDLLPWVPRYTGVSDFDYLLGSAALEMDRLPEAIAALRRSASQRPMQQAPRLALAEAYLRSGQNGAARGLLQELAARELSPTLRAAVDSRLAQLGAGLAYDPLAEDQTQGAAVPESAGQSLSTGPEEIPVAERGRPFIIFADPRVASRNDALLRDAGDLLKRGRWNDAYLLLAPHVPQRQGQAGFAEKFGIAARESGRLNESVQVLATAVAEHPGNHELGLEYARSLQKAGQLAPARQQYLRLQSAGLPPSLGWLVEQALLELNTDLASQPVVSAAAATPARSGPLAQRLSEARRLLRDNQPEAAYKLLTPKQERWGENSEFAYLLGVAATESGRPDTAIASLSALVEREPGASYARLELGRAYYLTGNRAAARAQFLQLREQPISDSLRSIVDGFLENLDARDAATGQPLAERPQEAAVVAEPAQVPTQTTSAVSSGQPPKHDQAGDGSRAKRLLAEAEALLAQGDGRSAYTLLAPYEADWSGHGAYDYWYGRSALESGRPEIAVAILQRAVNNHPDWIAPRIELARAHYEAGSPKLARAELEPLRQRELPLQLQELVERLIQVDLADPPAAANPIPETAARAESFRQSWSVSPVVFDEAVAVDVTPEVLPELAAPVVDVAPAVVVPAAEEVAPSSLGFQAAPEVGAPEVNVAVAAQVPQEVLPVLPDSPEAALLVPALSTPAPAPQIAELGKLSLETNLLKDRSELRDLLLRAETLLADGQAGAAYEMLSAQEPEWSGVGDFDYWYGHAAVESGRAELAVPLLKRALYVAPNSVAVRIELARAYYDSGDRAQARAELEQLQAQPLPEDLRVMVEQLLKLDFSGPAGATQDAIPTVTPVEVLRVSGTPGSLIGAARRLDRRLALRGPAAEAVLDQARAHLRADRGQDAYALLLPHEDDWAGRRDYDYVYGVSALDAGHPAEAVFALQRLLAQAPDFSGARLALARAWFALGDDVRAKAEFETLAADNPPPAVAQLIRNYQAAIERRSSGSPTVTGSVQLAAGFDSNANAATAANQFVLFDEPINLDSQSRETDSPFAELSGDFRVTVPLGPRLRLATSLGASHRSNPSASFVNATRAQGRAVLIWEVRGLQLSTGLNAHVTRLDQAANQHAGSLDLTLAKALDKHWTVAATARGGWLRFARALEARDVDQLIYGVSAERRFSGARSLRLNVSLLGLRELATDPDSPYGRVALGGQLGGSLALRPNLRLSAELGVLDSRYDQSFFASNGNQALERDDEQFFARVSGVWANLPGEDWSIAPRLTYIRNKSEIDLFSYDRFEAALLLKRVFH